MKENFVDSTTIHAVESLFRGSARDPWAARLAGEFADLFVYSDIVCYPIPVGCQGRGYDLAEEDSLLKYISNRDSRVFAGREYSTAIPRIVENDHLFCAFNYFNSWVQANQYTLRRWLSFHRSDWIQQRRAATTGNRGTFNLEELVIRSDITNLSERTNISPLDLCYAFDSILKYPLFGELTGSNGYYLNHPLRDAFMLPTMQRENATPPPVAVSFLDAVAKLSVRMSYDEYTSLLHELRGSVRESGLHEMSTGNFDRELIREVSARVRLSPRLSGYSKSVGISTGVIGGLGAIPVLGPFAAVFGGAISISGAFWSGGLPRQVASVSWLRWALKWDVEEQAERRL